MIRNSDSEGGTMNLSRDIRQTAPDVLGSSNTQLTQAITQIFHEIGGLDGLIEKFSDKGLEDVIKSWINTDSNKNITADQLRMILGPELLDGVAYRVGMTSENLSHQISLYLPLLVDRLSPEGKVPHERWWTRSVERLKEVFGLSIYL